VGPWTFTGALTAATPDFPVPAQTVICGWERKIAKQIWKWTLNLVKYKCTDGCKVWYERHLETKDQLVKQTVETEYAQTAIAMPGTDSEFLEDFFCVTKGRPAW
jgi:hypothetical protein